MQLIGRPHPRLFEGHEPGYGHSRHTLVHHGCPLLAPILVVNTPWVYLLLAVIRTLEIRGCRCNRPVGSIVSVALDDKILWGLRLLGRRNIMLPKSACRRAWNPTTSCSRRFWFRDQGDAADGDGNSTGMVQTQVRLVDPANIVPANTPSS